MFIKSFSMDRFSSSGGGGGGGGGGGSGEGGRGEASPQTPYMYLPPKNLT